MERVRRVAAVAATLVASVLVAVLVAAPTGVGSQAQAASSTASSEVTMRARVPATAPAPTPFTRVTLRAPGCRGCTLQLLNGAARAEDIWVSPSRTVRHGAVTFEVPTGLTRGISAVVRAPWEKGPPFTTVVVWRYGGHEVGDPVTFRDARTRHRATGCWAGTRRSAVTMRLTVRKVTVPGTTGPTAGSIAFADVTRRWLPPVFTIRKGVLGTQDVIICRK